jgi:hypothetical protein
MAGYSTVPPPNSKRFDAALQTRQFEIDLFWKRSLFFWGFIGAAFVAVGALKYDQPGLSLLVSSFGLVCSMAWTLANRGSKYWQEQWESKIENVEREVTGPLFQKIEPKQAKGWFGGREYSVSKLAILVSDYVSIIWLIIFIRQNCLSFGMTSLDRYRARAATCIILLTVIYVCLALWRGKSTPRSGETLAQREASKEPATTPLAEKK